MTLGSICTIPGLVGYERRVRRQEAGGTPIHRPGKVIKSGTQIKKINSKTNWYKQVGKTKDYKVKSWGLRKVPKNKIGCSNNPPSAPIFVQRTVGGTLVKQLRRIEQDLNKIGERRVKIMEEGGKLSRIC